MLWLVCAGCGHDIAAEGCEWIVAQFDGDRLVLCWSDDHICVAAALDRAVTP